MLHMNSISAVRLFISEFVSLQHAFGNVTSGNHLLVMKELITKEKLKGLPVVFRQNKSLID